MRPGRVLLAMAAAPLLAGCVSSLGPTDVANFAGTDEPQTTEFVVEAAGIETPPPADASTVDAAASAENSGEAAEALAAMEPADIVPQPAPRDGRSNPALNEGVALAFAESEPVAATSETPAPAQTTATEAAVPAETAEAQPPIRTAQAAAPSANRSLFAFLFQRRQAREADRPAPTPASFGTDKRATNSISGEAKLPGVRPTHQLFDATDADHGAEAEADYKVAAVGSMGRLSPNGLLVQTDKVDVKCLKPQLVAILGEVERHFGSKPVVTSGFRSAGRNRRAGGARQSLHMQCMAADIQVEGVSKWDLAKFLRTVPGRGGIGTYCRTRSVHVDIGELRDWHYPCRRAVKLKG